jgi:hypothetical protein
LLKNSSAFENFFYKKSTNASRGGSAQWHDRATVCALRTIPHIVRLPTAMPESVTLQSFFPLPGMGNFPIFAA